MPKNLDLVAVMGGLLFSAATAVPPQLCKGHVDRLTGRVNSRLSEWGGGGIFSEPRLCVHRCVPDSSKSSSLLSSQLQ